MYRNIVSLDEVKDEDAVCPVKSAEGPRNSISTPEFYNFTVNSDNVNMAVMLLRNKNHFSWLKDIESQKKIVELFDFLSDTDALSIIYFIHSTSCPRNFTAEYVAKNTGILEDKVTSILDASEKFGLCFKTIAHMVSGELKVYESFGEGNILSLVTLAYEHTCGDRVYSFNFTDSCSMIGGAKS